MQSAFLGLQVGVTRLCDEDQRCSQCGLYYNRAEPSESEFHKRIPHTLEDVFLRASGALPMHLPPPDLTLESVSKPSDGQHVYFALVRRAATVAGWATLHS